MKKTFIFIISILTITTLMAQAPGGGHRHRQAPPEPPKVEEMVSNLSAIQKKRLEGISENCKKQTAKLQKELDEIRSQIRNLMMQDGAILEEGTAEEVLDHPKCKETAELLEMLREISM